MAKNFVFDNFSDVFAFRAAIQSRPDSGHGGTSAKEGREDFAGMPLNRAYEALTDGIPEAADKLKKELERFKRVTSGTVTKCRPINYYNGSSPNVPAAIIGLPKSMRKRIKTPQKTKTVTLFYNSSAHCGVSAEDLEKAGSAVLQLVYWLELNGYRVKLTLVPYLAESSGEEACCSVLLKDFQQPLDVLKLSFSLTSVSMFRRLGFRWIETQPAVRSDSWKYGYGCQINGHEEALKRLNKAGQNTKDGYFIMYADCREAEYDALKLAEQLGIKVGER